MSKPFFTLTSRDCATHQSTQPQALFYHAYPSPGKVVTMPSKSLGSAQSLALAYTPGVALACKAIEKDPLAAKLYTSASATIAIITNGTAVLGLGDIGPLAALPVMEGKAALFQAFAGLNATSISLNLKDQKAIIATLVALEPSFGGINLEDIKAPECFHIEKEAQDAMGIPVFHDDQHGTAITVAAALINALKLTHRTLDTATLVAYGAGAGALSCLELLVSLGLRREHVILCDSQGIVRKDRPHLSQEKSNFATQRNIQDLPQALKGADIFLGLSSGGGQLPLALLDLMAPEPIIFTLANPVPEFDPQHVKQCRPDSLHATGRSDFPNQVNNVLCFPYMFKAAMDIGAKKITQEMKHACVHALSQLAQEGFSDILGAYGGEILTFSKDYFIPKVFDARLLARVPAAIAKALKKHDDTPVHAQELATYQRDLYVQAYRHRPIFRALVMAHDLFHSELCTSTHTLESQNKQPDSWQKTTLWYAFDADLSQKVTKILQESKAGAMDKENVFSKGIKALKANCLTHVAHSLCAARMIHEAQLASLGFVGPREDMTALRAFMGGEDFPWKEALAPQDYAIKLVAPENTTLGGPCLDFAQWSGHFLPRKDGALTLCAYTCHSMSPKESAVLAWILRCCLTRTFNGPAFGPVVTQGEMRALTPESFYALTHDPCAGNQNPASSCPQDAVQPEHNDEDEGMVSFAPQVGRTFWGPFSFNPQETLCPKKGQEFAYVLEHCAFASLKSQGAP